jgi:hypothetical protein
VTHAARVEPGWLTVETEALFDFVRAALRPYELATAPREVVEALSLSERSKRFLLEVGLPRRETVPGFEFDLVHLLPMPADYVDPTKYRFDESWAEVRLVADHFGVLTYIDTADAGAVWYVAPDKPRETCFVNSSVEQLGLVLATFLSSLASASDAKRSSRNWWAELEHRLTSVDPEAMESWGFWPLIVDDQRMLLIAD